MPIYFAIEETKSKAENLIVTIGRRCQPVETVSMPIYFAVEETKSKVENLIVTIGRRWSAGGDSQYVYLFRSRRDKIKGGKSGRPRLDPFY